MSRTHYRNGDPIRLQAHGCDGCSPSMINGILCHEDGCPDRWRDAMNKCRVCLDIFVPEFKFQAVCDGCKDSETCDG